MAEIEGRVSRVIFRRESFNIFDFFVTAWKEVPAANKTTCKGNLYGLVQIDRDTPLRLTGEWVADKKFGRQFNVHGWQPFAKSRDDVRAFLNYSVDGFIDFPLCNRIAEAFGTDAYDVLTNDPKKVLALTGFEDSKLDAAVAGWHRMLAARDLSGLLSAGGFRPFEISAVMGHFGLEAAEVIKDNPYRLLSIPWFSFEKVDKLARSRGVKTNDPRRVEGAVLWILGSSGSQGHLYIRRGDMPQAIAAKRITPPLPEGGVPEAIERLVESEAVVLDEEAGLYLPLPYHYERESARILARMRTPGNLKTDAAAFLAEYEKSHQIELSEAQREAVERFTDNRVLVLTGLPGTGKTTVVKTFVRLFEELKLSFSLMAPTGIAAKRLSQVTGHEASTIHRGLRYNGSEWGYDKQNRYVVDVVIVDEMSMVDQELFYRLVSALRPETMLVLVGDDAQLPSVGAGNVLKELVACKDIANVHLTQIFRQSERSDIVVNSHRINRGEMPEFTDPKGNSEFKFVRMSDTDRITRFVVEMAAKLKAQDANFQVLTAMYAGGVGVDNLNEMLRERLNPPGGQMEWKQGNLHFRVGDRLMVVKNDYERDVYNGDVGKLVRIYDKSLVVRIHNAGYFGDVEVEFPSSQVEEKLRLAYAVTVHKSQGNEFDTIVLPIVKKQGRMLQRNLLYTGITRARKRVWLVGEEAAIFQAVQNDKVVRRNTALSRVISDNLAAGVVPEEDGENLASEAAVFAG